MLASKNKTLAERLSLYQGPSVTIGRARNASPTFTHMGRQFHSAYDPEKEAACQAGEITARKPDWVLLFGLGCGHLLKAVLEKGAQRVLVYEPSMEILSGVLASVDLSAALSGNSVKLCADMASFISRVRELDGFDTLLSYSTTPYKLTFSEELADFTTRVNNAHITNKVCIQTDITSRESWVENYFENMKSLPECPPVDALCGAFKGVPMIIAGAGPSLAKNASLLKQAKGKAVIVAAITAYKPLLNYGVIPDFVIASERVDLPEYFTYGEEDMKTRLILAEVAHPGMFGRKVRQKFVFFNPFVTISHTHAPMWGSAYFPSTGGSVTTAAFDMAVMFGCDPVVLVGQDLCFGENGTHVPGGVYVSQDVTIDRESGKVSIEEDYVTLKDKARSKFDLLWLKGLDGKLVPSKFDWVTFHQWFENYMAAMKLAGSPLKAINATEGGAYIEGMEHATLSEVLEKYVKNTFPIDEAIDEAVSRRQLADLPRINDSIDQMNKALKEIGRIADAITREVALLKKGLSRQDAPIEAPRMIDKVKRLEEELFRAAESSPFIWETLIASICELKEYLREDAEAGSRGIEKDIEAIRTAYGKLSKGCSKFSGVLASAAASLRSVSIDEKGAARKAAV
ncbi:MAG: motility associated factor glycosyltransferase family protein [Deltaproteobacteria bacterium]|nr:motility associated factor glycosyltransferase family protein [Deltaproteobacteria bacterium]